MRLCRYLFSIAVVRANIGLEVEEVAIQPTNMVGWDPDLFPPTSDILDATYSEFGGYQMSEQSVKGWTIDTRHLASTLDCAVAFNRIPDSLFFPEGTVVKYGSCSIKVGNVGLDVPGELIDDFSLELLLILARGSEEPTYKRTISGTYFANFKLRAICMGNHERPCP